MTSHKPTRSDSANHGWGRPSSCTLGILLSALACAGTPILGGCEQALPTVLPASVSASQGLQDPTTKRTEPTRPVARQLASPPAGNLLRTMIDDQLDFIEQQRELSLERNAAWQIMHGVLAFGRDFQVLHGDQHVNALDWVLAGKPMKGWTLRKGSAGLRAELEPGKNGQGHEDQWLAVVSQSGIDSKHSLIVADRQYQMHDVLTQAMHDTYDGKECPWTLVGLSQYLQPIDQSWEAAGGSRWSVERMLTMAGGAEYDPEYGEQLVNEGACGGTHLLIGMAMVLARYQQQYPDRELAGGWKVAAERIAWAVRTARANQLPDGSFSIRYFERPARSRSVGENLGATGHTLELLAIALDRQQLAEPWVRRATV